MEWIRGHSMVIEPDEPPKHLRDEAPYATGVGPHHEFWQLPHLKPQLCSDALASDSELRQLSNTGFFCTNYFEFGVGTVNVSE